MNFSWRWLSSYNLDLTVHEFLGDEKNEWFLGDEKNEWFLGDEKNDKITDGLDSSRTSRTDMIHADTHRDPGGSIGHL